jgi:uncharacterized protein YecE (DUF72 family)
MALYIGTSGWHYRDWKEIFYPQGVAQKRWLEHYSDSFATVESNNAFYMLPKAETFRAWAERTPGDFVMAVKANRYLTHIRRLREPQEPASRFMENAKQLGDKLGPVLLQLPPNLKIDMENLDETLRQFGNRVPIAVEFRHDTWWTDEVRALLERHEAALCLTDRGSRPNSPVWRTADWSYLRFHWGTGSPDSCYGRAALASWVDRLAELWGPNDDVYVYFNNDPHGCALRDARVFARLAEKKGLNPTRVPKKPVHPR